MERLTTNRGFWLTLYIRHISKARQTGSIVIVYLAVDSIPSRMAHAWSYVFSGFLQESVSTERC